jgi:hypothetical protein
MGQLVFQAALGGQVNLVGPNTASTLNINVPAFAGTMASLASVNNNGVTYVNSSGQPTTLSTFVFDGTNLGIGTSSPTTFSGFKTLELANSSGNAISLVTGTGVIAQTIASNTTSLVYMGSRSNHPLLLTTNDTERMRIDTSGRVTMPYQPGFMAGIASTSDATIAINALVPFNTVTGTGAFNTGTNFSTSTSLFTAPIAGRYRFSFTLYLSNSGGNTQSMLPGIRINGSFISFTSGDVYGAVNAIPNSTGGTISVSTSVILNLAANDTVGVAARGTALRIYQGTCFFSGYLLG